MQGNDDRDGHDEDDADNQSRHCSCIVGPAKQKLQGKLCHHCLFEFMHLQRIVLTWTGTLALRLSEVLLKVGAHTPDHR